MSNSPSKSCWLSDREAAGRQGPQASRFRPTNAGRLDNLIKFKSSSQGTKRMPSSLVFAPAWLAMAAHMLTMRHPQRRVLRRSHVDSPSKNCWLSDREAAGRQGPQASRFRPTNAGRLDNLIKFKSSSQGTKRMPSSLVFAPAWLALAAHMLTMRHPRRRVLRRSHVDPPSKSCWSSDRRKRWADKVPRRLGLGRQTLDVLIT